MARRRIIDPSIWNDEDVASLSDGAFRVFVACISVADDEGRVHGSARFLRSIAFSLRPRVSVTKVDTYLTEIARQVRSFHRYEVDGRQYIQLLNWNKWQTIQKPVPSQIPSDPKLPQSSTLLVQYQYATGTVPVPLARALRGSTRGREVQGEVQGEENSPPSSPPTEDQTPDPVSLAVSYFHTLCPHAPGSRKHTAEKMRDFLLGGETLETVKAAIEAAVNEGRTDIWPGDLFAKRKEGKGEKRAAPENW